MEKLAANLLEELNCENVFTIPVFGGIGVSESTVVTWVIMAVLTLLAWLMTRNLKVDHISKRQAAVESAVLWLYSSGDGEKALTNTLGVITPWNTASDTTTLGAMQVEQVNTAILPGIDLPTAAAAQALTANEEALQGGTRGKAERTAFTQAALAALGAE